MKQTKFAFFLNKYFVVYLPNSNGCTAKTIDSYRYAFINFLTFLESQGISANIFDLKDLNAKTIIKYLEWLEKTKHNSVSTRNQRQSAINSFVRYLMYEMPEYIIEFQRILSIPVKKAPTKEISYLKTDGVKLFFDQVNIQSKSGFRDYAILAVMYSTGIRVSELINIKIKDLSLYEPPTLLVHGKGQKSRYVPIMNQTKEILKEYMKMNHLDEECCKTDWLFKSHMNNQFTRQGINYMITKYANKARGKNPDLIPVDFSPHKLRHTTAMELVDSGVDLIYIRDLLGHVSVKTTEIYAKAQASKKRAAIEVASKEIVKYEMAKWDNNSNLKEWLKNFNR